MQKVAVITGASGGIGLATARKFLKEGYRVYGIARHGFSGEFECFSADVRDYPKITEIFQTIRAREGRIDVLVNNAGFGISGAMEETSPERIRTMIDTDLTALCVLSSKIIPYLRETQGIIVNLSSVGGIIPLPYQAVYSAAKAGVEMFSRALAGEVKRDKIRVCAVLPGDTRTGFTAARTFEGENERAKRSVEKMSRDEQKGKSPDTVAKVIYKVAKRKRPPLRVSVGGLSKFEVFLTRIFSTRFVNAIVGKLYG